MEKKSLDTFISQANDTHSGKYDYSKVNYLNAHTKVCIICPVHGEFWQRPQDHIDKKQGCPKCSFDNRKLTHDEFISKAKEVHGNRYDYSKVEYKGWKQKVCIICPIHGEFWQDPTSHIAKHHKSGCPKCGKSITKTTEQFIQEAIKIHGNKYDYSKVNYINAQTKICIICPEHGEFLQKPYMHLRGNGCPKCNINKKTTEQFIIDAKKVHGNKYDYSKVSYVNAHTKVLIICSKHGEF
jgi:rubrerythrin